MNKYLYLPKNENFEIRLYRIKFQPFYPSTSSCILTRIYIRVRTSENVFYIIVSVAIWCRARPPYYTYPMLYPGE